MNGFELTERGKIIIAVLLVLILLVLPLIIILAFTSCSGTSPPSITRPSSPPTISNTPLPPNGSGVDPSIPVSPEPSPTTTPSSSPTPTTTPSPSPEPTPSGGNGNGDDIVIDDTPKYGPVGLNLTEGTMVFIYSPDEQQELDEETVDMLGDFLKSPKNTWGSLVEVITPNINADDEAELLSAVIQAFSLYNITENGLLFTKSGDAVSEQYFEVGLSFTAVSNQK